MIVYILLDTFISKEDAKKLGWDIEQKTIRFRTHNKKACRIIGYEQEGEYYIDILTESKVNKNHKNILFTYQVTPIVKSILIGRYGAVFHIPIV